MEENVKTIEKYVKTPHFSSLNEGHEKIMKTLSEASRSLQQTLVTLSDQPISSAGLKDYIVTNKKTKWKDIKKKDVTTFSSISFKKKNPDITKIQHIKGKEFKNFENEIFGFQLVIDAFGEGCSKI